MSTDISIVIVDDHPIFRQGLRQVLERQSGFTVLEEAGDGASALQAIERLRPRVAIIDVDMPSMDGLAVAREVRDRRIDTAVICLTMHNNARVLDAALEAGVVGYVVKDGALVEIVACVWAVASGRHHVSAQLTSHLITRRNRAADLARQTPVDALTDSERKVLRLLAEFKTTKEIADVLCLSPRTVDRHRANMVEKLGLNGSHALTRFAVEHRAAI